MAVTETMHTYAGYGDKKDDTGKIIASRVFIYRETAEDAKNYINPEEVAAALTDLETALHGSDGGIKKIQNQIRNVSVEAGGEMLIVRDATMEPIINTAADELDQIWAEVSGTLTEIQDFADKAFNDKQKEYNDNARENVRNYPGVTYEPVPES